MDGRSCRQNVPRLFRSFYAAHTKASSTIISDASVNCNFSCTVNFNPSRCQLFSSARLDGVKFYFTGCANMEVDKFYFSRSLLPLGRAPQLYVPSVFSKELEKRNVRASLKAFIGSTGRFKCGVAKFVWGSLRF